MASCPHIASSNLSPPRPTDSVYREDCTICFDSIDDPAGLDVCLHCFNGGCAGDRHHSKDHAQLLKHPLALNIKRTRKRKERDEGQPPEKITKIAIEAETEEDRYDTRTDVHCFECGITGLAKEGALGEVVEGVLKANTFAREAEVQAWEQELETCEHILLLEQEPGTIIASGDLAHCRQCDLKENLWLCLTCGNLGCGRKNYMNIGPPGNNHQVEHNKATGHPVAVKLGSLTADGTADIHCYACDEERLDFNLVEHLANWGIDISERVKTEKSVTEMQLEHNLNYDFSMTTADGKELKPLFGAGLTGLKNLGNSCYMASILQSVFSMPEFRQRYYRYDQSRQPVSKPADDLETQLRKIADGLLSGRYSVPDKLFTNSLERSEQVHQKGLPPAMLKHLIGKGHSEFSTMRQQDAFELLLHLLRLITRSTRTAEGQYKDIRDPVDAFRFLMEQRLECLNCHKVRYREEEMENLSIPVPIRRLPQEDTTMANGETVERKEEFEPVTLAECLDNLTSPEEVEYKCPSCGENRFSKQQLFKTFPDILAINARRFQHVNFVPTKHDVPVIVGDESFDFLPYVSKGKQLGEEDLPDDGNAGSGNSKGGSSFVPNETALAALVDMGFPRVRCEKALHATGNTDTEVALNWLMEHMDDPNIDTPVDLGGTSRAPAVGGAADPEKVDILVAMGFNAPQARQALKETDGQVERAIDWLDSHPDAPGDFGEDEAVIQPTVDSAVESVDGFTRPPPAPPRQDTDDAMFSLQSIVCHKGASIHAGHYVAFIKKPLPEGQGNDWVLFNDEKVALGGDVEEMKKFAYIYFFRRHRS